MRENVLKLSLIIIFISTWLSAYSQEIAQDIADESIADSIVIDSLRNKDLILIKNRKAPEIILSSEEAIEYLQKKYKRQYWNDENDPLRKALGQLVFEASNPPYDSAEYFLLKYPFDSLKISWDKFYIWEPLRLKIPYVGTPQFPISSEADTNKISEVTDSLLISESLSNLDSLRMASGLKDTTIMVIIDTLYNVTSSKSGFPFKYFDFPYQADSMKVAVDALIKQLEERDSTILNFTGSGKMVTSVWLNSKSERMARYWLKNEFSDSVTIWIGNPSRDTIGLYLEQGVYFRRPVKQGNYAGAKINLESIDNSKLLASQKIVLKQQLWKFRTEASYTLSQASLTNWVKGGENSIATALDLTGYADYNNKYLKLSSNHFARMKLGFLASGGKGIRKNLDLIETNSKLNHKAFGKFDFSGIMLFKTQLVPGYNYTKVNERDTSIMVSKFMNPAVLTIGLGLDYKPNKVTSLNFSPLSFKGTFVNDPAYMNNSYDSTRIDQTKYGIEKNKMSKVEPGASFMISNIYKPHKNVSITNRLQLFTNYIDNPLNIDVDWEVIVSASLNWYTDVRLNTHLIFDDDTRTPELDRYDKPILRPDGTNKETARIQFKEMLGFSFVFKF